MQAVDIGLSANNKNKPKNQLFCRLDGVAPRIRDERRLAVLQEMGLLVPEAVPIFEETTQKAADFSGAPLSILTLVVKDELWFKSAVGLSTIGLTAELAICRKMVLSESFSTYVVDSQQFLAIENTLNSSVFADSVWAQYYGIKAYLGVPLMNSAGVCLGTLEVMDWQVRKFNDRDIAYLTLLAQWCLSEFECYQGRKNNFSDNISSQWQRAESQRVALNYDAMGEARSNLNPFHRNATSMARENFRISDKSSPIKIKLLSQLTQELRTPLTSVIGMASVLHREVYGPLTIKQREYLEIIHDSGQNLISLVDEIVSLGVLSEQGSQVELAAVDIEMLCQQVANNLKDLAKQYQQTIGLSMEPGNRIWSLDKEKIRQAIYYLIVSVLEMSEPGGEVKLHVSRRDQVLNIALGVSHPWLGDDFAETKLCSQTITEALKIAQSGYEDRHTPSNLDSMSPHSRQLLTADALMMVINEQNIIDKNSNKIPRDILGLLFCCYLVELHGGRLLIQSSPSSSYRYILQIPQTTNDGR